MTGVAIGMALTRARLRGVSGPLVLLLCSGVAFALGVLARRAHADTAADDTLRVAVFGSSLPVLAYLLCDRVCAGQGLEQCVECVARYGASRRGALLGVLLGSALYMGLASALLTFCALLGAHATGPALTNDLRVSLGIAFLAGAVYVLWFSAASRLGRRGGGRKWALVLDFLLGAGASALAAPWPRGHLRNLLGGAPVLGLSQPSAWLALSVIAGVSLLLCFVATPD